MADPFKHPVSGIYYLRRRVPAELRPALGHEYKRSLKTRDPGQAKSRYAAAWTESDAAFAVARAGLAGIEAISLEDSSQLAARWFRSEQARLERSRRFTEMLAEGPGGRWSQGDHEEEWTSYLTLAQAAAQGEGPPNNNWAALVAPHIRTTLREHSLPLPPSDSLVASHLNLAFIEHLHKLSSWALQRHEGEFTAPGQDVAPIAPLATERQKERRTKQIRLPALFDSYSNEKILNDGDTRATRKTIASFKSTVERFVELVGDLHISDIDRDAVGRFRASLARMPAKGEGTRGLSAQALIAKADAEDLTRLSEPTIRNQLRALSAVLSHAVRLDWLSENPVIAGGAGRAAAKAATRRTATTRKRKEYTRSELQAIFNSPAFASKNWKPARADFGEAWYWLPVLLFYTGARREELAQLKATDVRKSDEGIWHLNILAVADEEDGDRGVKTESSRRLIPLHSDVMDRGFLVYLNSVDKSGQLFPELKANPAGYYGANFGKHWTKYLRSTVRLESPVSPMHGFRHTFKTLCRDVGIAEEVHDALTGHAGSGGVGRDYGSMSLPRMSKELSKFPCIHTL